MPLLEPTPLLLRRQDGKEITFILHKFGAIAGREIIAKYPMSNVPKVGEYKASEEVMLKLMAYVGVELEGREQPLMLTTRDLIDNHCGDWETLAQVEWGMLQHNCSFFKNGLASTFFEGIAQKVAKLIAQTLTASSEQSSPPGAPRSTN